MNLRLPLIVVAMIVASPLLVAGDAHPIAVPGTGPMPGISGIASIDFGDDGGFAAWRVGFGEIWGVPLDLTGRPLRPARLLLRDQFGTDGASVQWDGRSFVLWWGAKTARIDREGNVLDTKVLAQSARPVASNGNVTLDFGFVDGYDLVEHVYDLDRNLLLTTPVVGVGRIFGVAATVLRDGTFAVATTGWDGLYLTRFDAKGKVSGAPLLIEAARGTTSTAYRAARAALATDGETILVVWSGVEYGRMPQLKSAIVMPGNALSEVRTLADARWMTIAGLAAGWTSSRFTVSVAAGQWEGRENDDLDIYAIAIARDGEVVLPDFVPIVVRPGLELSLSMSAPSGRPLIFFQQGDYGMTELLLVDLSSGSLTRPDPSAVDASLTVSAAWQWSAVAASDGLGWLAAWLERTATRDEIRAVPLDRDGRPVASPLTIAGAPRLWGAPQVAFNGIDYMVAWMQGDAILIRRLRRDGSVVDGEPIVIRTARAYRFAMSARAGVTFLVWPEGAIHGATLLANGRVTPSVALSSEPVVTSTYSVSYDNPVVTAGNETSLVAWEERRTSPCTGIPCPSSSAIEMRLFTTDLAPASGFERLAEGAPYAAASAGGTHLLVFGSGAGVLVDERTGHVSPPLVFGALARPFSLGDEYLVSDVTEHGAVFIRRVASDGTMGPRRGTDAFALPAAANASGTLLALRPVSTPGAPYWGAPANFSQVIDSVSPDPLRRRPTRR